MFNAPAIPSLLILFASPLLAQTPPLVAGCSPTIYFQDFEVDEAGWNIFGLGFEITRVPSLTGPNGIVSADGGFHAEGVFSAGNWGGYSGDCGCAATACAQPFDVFPTGGYMTSIDIYLDVDAAHPNDTNWDFSSAINNTLGQHRRDFIFNAAFFDSGDMTAPGGGMNRFIIAASNNSPGTPQLGIDPVAITTSGWYTFQHRFRDDGSGVLACDFMIFDPGDALVAQWTRSDPSDIIGSTVGGNRYGWFSNNDFPFVAVDNALRIVGPVSGDLVLEAADCQDDAFPGSSGYQVAVELEMRSLFGPASGYQAFVEYDMGTLAYRGDLSSYEATPFALNISPILQADDGRLELDASAGFLAPGTLADALLATLVFDVLVGCEVPALATFEVGGAFNSELSFLGVPFSTTLVDAAAVTLDDTPPILAGIPADIVQPADAGSCIGAVVSWTDPTATDLCDLAPIVACSPPSGSFFPVGVSMVTCTATDACGNVATSTFSVEVTPTNAVQVLVQLPGSEATARCIHFQADTCSSTAEEVMTFVGSPATAVATIEIPCGVYTKLCAKDEQHTKWGQATLSVVGSVYVAGPIVLDGGDTDNDGDIDINDVTWFLGQFGDLAVAGGCPFGGARDADFSNNGAIGAEDYAFLVAGWLSLSSCPCTLPLVVGGPEDRTRKEVRDQVTRKADLNGDGWIDVLDVELFEARHGLSGELSMRMRATAR